MEKSILGKGNKIYVDDKEYTVEQQTISGSDIRNIANLDVSAELWQAIPGPNNDKFIASFDIITVEDGAKFISLKKTICPGK